MKIIFVVVSLIGVLVGCKDAGNRATIVRKMRPLHFAGAEASGSMEPIALLNFGGVYRIFYSTSGGAGSGKTIGESDPGKLNGLAQSTSKDLISWSKGAAFSFPKYNGAGFHGAIFIDSVNPSGYGTRKKPPLVAVFSVAPFLAFSTDEGNSWVAATGTVDLPKPFISHPQNISILWYPSTRKWIMSLAVTDHVEFYSSSDLRSWTFESSVGEEFFPEEIKWKRTTLFSSGVPDHWVLLADIKKSGEHPAPGGTVYFVGSFDGHRFVNQSAQLHWLDYGEDVYSSLVSIGEDGRRIHVGWREGEIITIPRELKMVKLDEEWVIAAAPIPELGKIYGKKVPLGPVRVSYKAGDVDLVSGLRAPMEVFLKFNTSGIQKGSFPIRFGVSFGNDKGEHMAFVFDRFGYYYIDRSGLAASSGTPAGGPGETPGSTTAGKEPVKMPFDHADSTMSFHFIVDASVIECFAEGGKLVMTGTYSSGEPLDRLKLFSVNGNIDLLEGEVVELGVGRP